MSHVPKIDILPLIKQLESFRIDQEYKLELGQALMLGAAMGLQQQYEKIGVLDSKIKRLKLENEKLTQKLQKHETHNL